MLYQLSYFRNFATEVVFSIADAKVRLIFESASVFGEFLANYFLFFSNYLLIRYSILFSCFVEFRLHGRIFVGEFADSEFLGVLIGQAKVVFRT